MTTTLVLAAHPDDEIIGAGIWLHRHSRDRLYVLHITDGSPKDMHDARALGFPTRHAYAEERRKELAEAIQMLPIPLGNCIQFPFADKEAYLNLPAIVSQLDDLVQKLRPDLVLSPAYEGGHPDHDSAAFAAASVRRKQHFEHKEFPLYHAGSAERMVTGSFIDESLDETEVLELSTEEQTLKTKMFACFRTQEKILSNFAVDNERFRPARPYDFKKTPHPGPLLYERWGWGIDGTAWRKNAGEARAY